VDADGTYKHWQTGLLTQASANVPRMTPDRTQGEAAATNLCLRSNEFGNVAWGKFHATNPPTQDVTGPDGVANSAWTVTTAAGGNASVSQLFAGGILTDNLQYTLSCRVRQGTAAAFTMIVRDMDAAAERAKVDFVWTAGVLSVKSADIGTGSVSHIGGGWYVASATVPASVVVGANGHGIYCKPSEDGNEAVGTTTIFYGVQLELGSAPSTYTPTVASSVVRAADALVFPSPGNIVASAGTVMLAATLRRLPIFGQNSELFDTRDGVGANNTNMVIVGVLTASNKPFAYIMSGGAEQADLASTSAITVGVPFVCAIAWAGNDARFYINGGDEKSDTSVVVPASFGSMNIGRFYSGSSYANGEIGHLIIFNRALSSGEIQAIVRNDYTRWCPQLSL